MSYEEELGYEVELLRQADKISPSQDRCLCREPLYLGWPQLVGYPAFKCNDCGKPKLRVSMGDTQSKEIKYLIADGPGKPYRVVYTYNPDERMRARFKAAVEGVMQKTGCSYEQAVRALVTVNPANQQFVGNGEE